MKTLYLFPLLFLSFSVSLFSQNNSNKAPCANAGAACINNTNEKNGGNEVLYDGSGSLGPTYNKTACGLNYVQGYVLIEQRSAAYSFNANGTGLPTSITISGLPSSYVIDKAYLWYIASYTSGSAPTTKVDIVNPNLDTATVSSALIGIHGPKCWSDAGSASYRADVTSTINGNGIYTIDIKGFNNGSNEVDGATLMVIYKDNTAAYQGSLNISDGIMTSGGSNGYPAIMQTTVSGFNVCEIPISAFAFLIVSDMQSNVNGGMHVSTLNGNSYTFPNNFYNFDSSSTILTAHQSSSTFSANGQGSDCFALGVAGLYYQTVSCTTCLLTSANELDKSQQQVKVFPNPTDGSFFIELTSPVKDAEVKIYDLLGKEILRKKFSGNKIEIQKVNLESGVYFLRVQADEKYFTEKLVVR